MDADKEASIDRKHPTPSIRSAMGCLYSAPGIALRVLGSGLVALIALSCTGINLGASIGGPNTHPARPYAYLVHRYTAGGVVHRNVLPGQLGGQALALRTGRACSHSVLWAIAWGDSSIEAARLNGEIEGIASVEHEVFAALGFLYHQHCTLVSGE